MLHRRYRTRCACIADTKWWDMENNLASPQLNEYISENARISAYTGEFPQLLDLKRLPYKVGDSVEYIRGTIQNSIPFKPTMCSFMLSCCGMCDKRCDKRCVQDMYTKLYFRMQRGDMEAQVIRDMLTNPGLNYDTLRDLYDSVYTKFRNDTVKRESIDPDAFKFNYAPRMVGKTDRRGRQWLEVDPVTGDGKVLWWPQTGLCPYCMPRITHYTIRGRK